MPPEDSTIKLFRSFPIKNGIAILVALYFLNYLVTPIFVGEKLEIYFRPHLGLKFDSDIWKQGGLRDQKPNLSYGKRFEMLDDLLASGILSKTANFAEDILGKPDSTTTTDEITLWFYVLGDQRTYPAKSFWFPGRFANFDRWMLEVVIENGKVSQFRVFYS